MTSDSTEKRHAFLVGALEGMCTRLECEVPHLCSMPADYKAAHRTGRAIAAGIRDLLEMCDKRNGEDR